MALIRNTKPVREIRLSEFDAILVAGGQAPMFTFAQATDLQAKFVEFYLAGKVAAVLCPGVALLRHAMLPDGEPPVRGKTVTLHVAWVTVPGWTSAQKVSRRFGDSVSNAWGLKRLNGAERVQSS